MASQRAAAAQAAEQQWAELTAMQQRIDQTVAQARQEANEKAWDEYEVLAGGQDRREESDKQTDKPRKCGRKRKRHERSVP